MLALGLAFLLFEGRVAQAGTLYYDSTSFNNAVVAAGLSQTWSENYQSFALGSGALGMSIGGHAQITYVGTTNPLTQGQGPNSTAIISGMGGTALGVQALAFNYGYDNGPLQASTDFWQFNSTSGQANSAAGNVGSGLAPTNFFGWIGTGSETLNSAQISAGVSGSLDNIEAFGDPGGGGGGGPPPNPEPASMTLLAIGIVGMAAYGLKRRKKAAAAAC
jgi:PEP-CTERM motif